LAAQLLLRGGSFAIEANSFHVGGGSVNGHRRVNVLFTRAKKRSVVFSSLDPERI
jgi:superfamily I DNA and/or RNA helicase